MSQRTQATWWVSSQMHGQLRVDADTGGQVTVRTTGGLMLFAAQDSEHGLVDVQVWTGHGTIAVLAEAFDSIRQMMGADTDRSLRILVEASYRVANDALGGIAYVTYVDDSPHEAFMSRADAMRNHPGSTVHPLPTCYMRKHTPGVLLNSPHFVTVAP